MGVIVYTEDRNLKPAAPIDEKPFHPCLDITLARKGDVELVITSSLGPKRAHMLLVSDTKLIKICKKVWERGEGLAIILDPAKALGLDVPTPDEIQEMLEERLPAWEEHHKKLKKWKERMKRLGYNPNR